MSTSNDNERLADNIDRSIEYASKLKDILINERIALEEKNTLALSKCAIDKKKCVNQLDDLERKRSMLIAHEKPPEYGAESSHFDQDGAEFPASWNHFLDIVRACDVLNAGNGAIILTRQSQIQAAISLLRGGTKTADTYNNTGRNADINSVRSLAEA